MCPRSPIIKEHYTFLSHVERGKRSIPDNKIPKFASLLDISEKELRALQALQKADLSPDEFLPDVGLPFITPEQMERMATKCLYEYTALAGKSIGYPLPAEKILKTVYGLDVRFIDFEKEKIYGKKGEALYACLYPDGRFFKKHDRVILVNTGLFNGRRLTASERLISTAHEAGHYALQSSRINSPQLSFSFSSTPYFCSSISYKEAYDRREYLPTLFAACFLMPREDLLKTITYADSVDLNSHGEQLRRKFGVTLSFLKFRLSKLGIKTN